MAVFQFSALADGQAIAFDASADRLNFDQTNVAAGDLTLTQEGSNLRVTVKSGTQAGKDVLLTGMSLEQVAATNFSFVDGSVARVGDNAVGTTGDANGNAITGGTGRDLLMGLGGNDTLTGGDNNDSLVGGAGNDNLNGNSGNDWLEGNAGNDTLTGSGGQDAFLLREIGAANADLLADFASNWDNIQLDAAAFTAIGAAGRFTASDARFFAGTAAHDADDRIIYHSATGQIFYDADGNGAGAQQLIATLPAGRGVVASDFNVFGTPGSGGNTINGSAGNDTLTGTPAPDTINGFGGNDSLFGGDGADSIVGGDGNDTLNAGNSRDPDDGTLETDADTLDGGLGDDLYIVHDGVVVLADPGGVDWVWAERVEWTLGAGQDNLRILATADFDGVDGTGNELANIIDASGLEHGGTYHGMGGNDTLLGAQHGGQLFGDDGDDVLHGEMSTQAPSMFGGNGNDTLITGNGGFSTGGAGSDSFVYLNAGNGGIVTDFVSGVDQIHLDASGNMNALGTTGNLTVGDARFFAAAGATSGHDADDRVIYDTSTGNFYYDADGSGAGLSMLIGALQGAPSLAASDIVVDNGPGAGQTINGTANNDNLVGGPGNDTINAFGGNDTIDGRGGVDVMDGGAGNDLYFVDEAEDRTIELENDGIDEVRSSAQSYGLNEWVNNLTLTNNSLAFVSGAGNAIDNVVSAVGLSILTQLDGFGGNDTLLGGSGNDELNGWAGNDSMVGGAGNDTFDGFNHPDDGIDTMDGGAGDDTFFVSAGDVVSGGTGTDTVFARISWTLDATSENLHFHTGNDDHDLVNVTGIGNALDNVIDGTVINGATLDGKAGNDTLIGSDLLPTDYLFTVSPGAANADLIGNFVGRAGGEEDRIVLDGAVHANSGPSGAFVTGDARFWSSSTGTAHDADDRVVYNTSTGQLWYDADGNGAGAAQLVATLAGAPTLLATDIAIVNGSGGGGAGQTIFGTSGNDSLVGTTGNDSINGGSGNDTLAGGAGNDTLTGSGGQDAFIFREFGSGNADRMTDFATNWDRIQVDDAAFTAAGAAGRLAAGDARFFAGTAAHDADDRFVFNAGTGQLYYDADGNGSGAAQLVATVQAGATVAATDITVI